MFWKFERSACNGVLKERLWAWEGQAFVLWGDKEAVLEVQSPTERRGSRARQGNMSVQSFSTLICMCMTVTWGSCENTDLVPYILGKAEIPRLVWSAGYSSSSKTFRRGKVKEEWTGEGGGTCRREIFLLCWKFRWNLQSIVLSQGS